MPKQILKRGSYSLIAKELSLSRSTISNYFRGISVGESTLKTIENYLTTTGRSYLKVKTTTYRKASRQPPIERIDILNNLKWGNQSIIADKFNTSSSHVSNILNGRNDTININTILSRNIIREAEMFAAINIWKTRFCKFESLL